MNAQTARMFLAIVEHGSISAAARALYITQPALSAHLGRLEEELGAQLMRRQKGIHQITLTPEGAAFVPIAQEWASAEDHFLQYKDTVSRKTLRLLAGTSAHDVIVAPIISKLLRNDPQLAVQQSIQELYAHSVISQHIHRFDIAFSFFRPTDSPLVDCIPLFQQEYYILCPADSPLPDRVLSLKDLDPAFQVMQKFAVGNLRRWYQSNFSEAPEDSYAQTTTILSTPTYFRDPRCWGICSANNAMFLIAQQPDTLSFRRIETAPSPSLCSLLISKSYARSDVIETLLRCCREYLQERPYLTPLLK